MERDYKYLIEQYRQIWHNRELISNGDDEATLRDAILRELLDENSHPRVRKSIFEKFSYACKRIIDSSLSSDVKVELIELHLEILQSKAT